MMVWQRKKKDIKKWYLPFEDVEFRHGDILRWCSNGKAKTNTKIPSGDEPLPTGDAEKFLHEYSRWSAPHGCLHCCCLCAVLSFSHSISSGTDTAPGTPACSRSSCAVVLVKWYPDTPSSLCCHWSMIWDYFQGLTLLCQPCASHRFLLIAAHLI